MSWYLFIYKSKYSPQNKTNATLENQNLHHEKLQKGNMFLNCWFTDGIQKHLTQKYPTSVQHLFYYSSYLPLHNKIKLCLAHMWYNGRWSDLRFDIRVYWGLERFGQGTYFQGLSAYRYMTAWITMNNNTNNLSMTCYLYFTDRYEGNCWGKQRSGM